MYNEIKRLRALGKTWPEVGQCLHVKAEKARSIYRRGSSDLPNKELDLRSEELPIEDLLQRRIDDTSRRLQAVKHNNSWVKFHIDTPVMLLAVIGDPHLDDNYCNFDILESHVEICENDPSIFRVPIGDTTNNWVGRLMKEYADQDTTKTQALQLIEWFLDSLHPRINVHGNHDLWSAQENFMAYVMKKQSGLDVVWQVKAAMQFPNGWDFRCWFAHDFPGRSASNPNYAEFRRGMAAGEPIHLLAAGHRHYWSIQQTENEWNNEKMTLVRAKGYKDFDEYALQKGFGQQYTGHTIGVVVDSTTKEVVPFDDFIHANEYYKWKKKIHKMD